MPASAVPIRTGWPTHRISIAGYLAVVAVIFGAVLVALVHRPSTVQQAADLRGFVSDMRADVGSCAADVGASLAALRAIESGSSTDVGTALFIARSGAGDCAPANDELLDYLIQYQVTESLAQFRLGRVVDGLVAWAAPDAQRVQEDVLAVLAAHNAAAKLTASAALSRDLRVLDSQRASVDSIIRSASHTLGLHISLPILPG